MISLLLSQLLVWSSPERGVLSAYIMDQKLWSIHIEPRQGQKVCELRKYDLVTNKNTFKNVQAPVCRELVDLILQIPKKMKPQQVRPPITVSDMPQFVLDVVGQNYWFNYLPAEECEPTAKGDCVYVANDLNPAQKVLNIVAKHFDISGRSPQ